MRHSQDNERPAFIIFPHHLTKKMAGIPVSFPVFLVEEHLFFRQYRFHKQKLIFHRAGMKTYEKYLQNIGFSTTYIESANPCSDIRALMNDLSARGFNHIHLFDPCDDWLKRRIHQTAEKYGISVFVHESPLFINTKEDLNGYANGRKTYFQTDFYIYQRKKRNILVTETGQPSGGKWSFDQENRKAYPKKTNPPAIPLCSPEPNMTEAKEYINRHFPDNPGLADFTLPYPVSFETAEQWFENFLKERFHGFGEYEDAMVEDQSVLHHSVLSPLLNVGLLDPLEVIMKSIQYAENHEVPFNSLEGFVRQILGWREFIRYVYVREGRHQRTRNFWGFEKPIPETFYTAQTGIKPVDNAIQKVLNTGYNHHIERLMILSNFMLLSEIRPDAVYQWFMEMYIDAYDWVMVPNVYGMGQFADGGLMCTKPYISGSNYILKMSNFAKDPSWTEDWDALFWRFMHVHRDFLKKNPRLSMLISAFDKWPEPKKESYLSKATLCLQNLHHEKSLEPA
jgi:deoxyribodipyrimidine photolyase-related protein